MRWNECPKFLLILWVIHRELRRSRTRVLMMTTFRPSELGRMMNWVKCRFLRRKKTWKNRKLFFVFLTTNGTREGCGLWKRGVNVNRSGSRARTQLLPTYVACLLAGCVALAPFFSFWIYTDTKMPSSVKCDALGYCWVLLPVVYRPIERTSNFSVLFRPGLGTVVLYYSF